MCVEPSLSYGVDTGDVENGLGDDESEAVEKVGLSSFEPVATETPSLVAPEDEQSERLLDLS